MFKMRERFSRKKKHRGRGFHIRAGRTSPGGGHSPIQKVALKGQPKNICPWNRVQIPFISWATVDKIFSKRRAGRKKIGHLGQDDFFIYSYFFDKFLFFFELFVSSPGFNIKRVQWGGLPSPPGLEGVRTLPHLQRGAPRTHFWCFGGFSWCETHMIHKVFEGYTWLCVFVETHHKPLFGIAFTKWPGGFLTADAAVVGMGQASFVPTPQGVLVLWGAHSRHSLPGGGGGISSQQAANHPQRATETI